MAITVIHWRERVEALLAAVQDVKSGPSDLHPSRAHLDLFDGYVRELRAAKQGADTWWNSLIETEAARSGNQILASRIVKLRWPVGPVAHKYVIAVVRKFWLACEEINGDAVADYRFRPEHLVLKLLVPNHPELAEFLSALPFWPMGIDAKGNWI